MFMSSKYTECLGSLSILNKLDNLLADYEYYDTPPPPPPLPEYPGSNNSSMNGSVNTSVNGSVNTLVSYTNQLLLELNNKYTNLDNKVRWHRGVNGNFSRNEASI